MLMLLRFVKYVVFVKYIEMPISGKSFRYPVDTYEAEVSRSF
jgi:hypothetical protein